MAKPLAGSELLRLHGVALGLQLRVLRDGLARVAELHVAFAFPRLTCYCDRDPSGTLPVLRNGCRLPSAESESYVPFDCPLDHRLEPIA
eukprot:521719-Prymnesium_polylepis.1